MSALINQTCDFSANRQALSLASADALLTQLTDWQISQPAQSTPQQSIRLQKTFRFANFIDALAFVNKVGDLAETVNHHPEIRLTWGMAEIHWWSHDLQGLHQNDFILAAKTDALL